VAINPATPAAVVFDLLSEVDIVLVMTVQPGFAGGLFIPYTVRKVEAIRRAVAAAGCATEVGVDGSINPTTIPALAAAGADVFVGGSSGLFTGRDIGEEVRRMRKSAGLRTA
jgi:ribulose-phosphate 3-epimerase